MGPASRDPDDPWHLHPSATHPHLQVQILLQRDYDVEALGFLVLRCQVAQERDCLPARDVGSASEGPGP